MKIRRGGWVHRLLSGLAARAQALDKERAMLDEALGHAYEGLVITDDKGVILKSNRAYAQFMGFELEQLLGKHVTDVIPNTRMHIVARTGVAEIAQVQKIRGHDMVCSRIPIFEDGKVVAVVGKVMFQDIGDLFAMTGRLQSLKTELEFYKSELNKRLAARYSLDNMVGRSKQLEALKALARKVAKSDSTLLLQGESGTGKELLAHGIHIESNRALGPFVKLNCSAIPEALFESELFGYKAGAFTGASKQGKKGKFALADRGTLLLDEISELPPSMQVKLLRVLQEREIEPVGSVEPEPIDVRILAATNRDLRKLIDKGEFREDLFYRLNVVKLEIPPLRDRGEDLLPLIDHLLKQLEKETGIPVEGLAEGVEELLAAYRWPGNVRELKNVLEQALYVKAGERIARADLPRALVASVEENRPPEPPQRLLKVLLRRTEEEAIRAALLDSKGNKLLAAQQLGISKSSLYAKVDEYGIHPGGS
jgi:PAS domain S-box-containing protein